MARGAEVITAVFPYGELWEGPEATIVVMMTERQEESQAIVSVFSKDCRNGAAAW